MEKTRREFLQMFGLPEVEELSAELPQPTRREFMQLVGMMVAAAAVLPNIIVPEREPVRRFWAVGTDFKRSGVCPIEGQPGLFRDASTGQILNIRDFTESDKYDTIVIPKETEFPLELRGAKVEYPLIKNRGGTPSSDLTFNLPDTSFFKS